MAMVENRKKGVWRELRHKDWYCCFGWTIYSPWACYMALWILCVSKLAKSPLICLGDLGNRYLAVAVGNIICTFNEILKCWFQTGTLCSAQ